MTPAVPLGDVTVRVVDATGWNEENVLGRRGEAPFAGIAFAIEVERRDGSAGWMLTHSYTDFMNVYDGLREHFPKVSKSSFPFLGVGRAAGGASVRSTPTATTPEGRSAVARDLERWLAVMLMDEVLCQHRALQDFMMPEHLRRQMETRREQRRELLAREQRDREAQEQQGSLQRQVFGGLKLVGRVVKKAAVSTGNVVGSVGGAALGLNAGRKVSGDTPAPPGRDSWEKKLEQRRSSPNRATLEPGSTTMSRSASHNSSLSTAGSINKTSDHGANLGDAVPPPVPALPARVASGSPTKAQQPPLTPAELEVIMDCLFGTIEEVFHLSDPNQWIRQKGLHVVKSLLRRTHGSTISQLIQSRLEEAKSTEKVTSYLKTTTESMWPGGVWHANAGDVAAAPAGDASRATPADGGNDGEERKAEVKVSEKEEVRERTEEEKGDTRVEAKHLLLKCSGLLGLDGLERVLGKYNTVVGVTRLFNMVQHRELNKGLMCAVLEAFVKSMLSDAN
ncbi:sorting nexin 13 [Irineochytrium annulatum]|nr:sorting nexin 13 [Irineochytrium annulatum]